MRETQPSANTNYYQYKNGKYIIQAAAIPESINITSSTRVGTLQRSETVRHLNLMHARGYLDDSQHSARVHAAVQCSTLAELHNLTADLPVSRRRLTPFSWQAREWFVPILLSTAAASALTAIMPVSILASLHLLDSAGGVSVTCITIVIGVITFAASVITMCCKLENN